MSPTELLIANLCCYSWLAELDAHPTYEEKAEGI